MVSVGTHRLHLYCEGAGGPAVILESGIGSGWETWSSVVAGLTPFSTVCVYDRSGYGWSESGPRSDRATAARITDEFHSLLVNASMPGPYILIAHSFGAYIARLYADRYPDRLLGLVFVDPSQEDEPHLHSMYRTIHGLIPPTGLPGLAPFFEGDRALPPALRTAPAAFRRRSLMGFSDSQARAARRELSSLDTSEAEVRAAHFPPGLPLIVITATHIVTTDRIGDPEMPNTSRHFELQAKLAALSSRGRQIVVKSGHLIQLERPDSIVSAVRQLMDCCLTRLQSENKAP